MSAWSVVGSCSLDSERNAIVGKSVGSRSRVGRGTRRRTAALRTILRRGRWQRGPRARARSDMPSSAMPPRTINARHNRRAHMATRRMRRTGRRRVFRRRAWEGEASCVRAAVRLANRIGKQKTRGRFRRGLRSSCDDVTMPVICPTCQILRKCGRPYLRSRNRLFSFAPRQQKTRCRLPGAGRTFFAMMSICP